MGDLLRIENLQVFLFFVAPGIIALFVRAQFMSGKMPPITEGVIAYVMVAVAYHALVYPISRYLIASTDVGWSTLGWFVLILVGPALLGLLLGLNIRQGWMRRLLAHVGVSTVHPVDCAWDWRFAGCQPSWVMVVLKDETKWAGLLGPGSFMSSRSEERDIFIEQVYDVSETLVWTPKGSGVWIAHGEIQSIEFWPLKQES